MSQETDFAEVWCPRCSLEPYMSKRVLNGLADLNIRRCSRCFMQIRLVCLDPLTIEVVSYES